MQVDRPGQPLAPWMEYALQTLGVVFSAEAAGPGNGDVLGPALVELSAPAMNR